MKLSDEENPQSLPCGVTADETWVSRVAEAELGKQSHSNKHRLVGQS